MSKPVSHYHRFVPLGNPDKYICIIIYLHRETHTCICIDIYTRTYIHTHNKHYGLFFMNRFQKNEGYRATTMMRTECNFKHEHIQKHTI